MNRSSVGGSRLAVLFALVFATPALAGTFNVTNTNDSGAGSFRQALIDANAAVGPDTIAFNIAGAGVHTITLTSLLPNISGPVTIDGYTQPGSSANTNAFPGAINAVPQVELTGAQLSLVFLPGSDGSTVRGLVINGSNGDKISSSISNLTVAGNFIGTNATGTATVSVGGFGVRASSGTNVTIGGPSPADRNLISGNAQGGVILPFPATSGHLIQGNFIGTDIAGNIALPNGLGLDLVSGTQVLQNLISGNGSGGVLLLDGNVVRGNLIGTRRDGTTANANGNFGGINIDGNGNTIGGAAPGQGNVIAFNANSAIDMLLGSNGNRISQNSIFSNAALGITLVHGGTPLANDPLDSDVVPANHGQNYPVITSAAIASGNATIAGTINSNAATQLHLEFFASAACDASGNGEGQTFIGATDVTTDASGNASFAGLVFAVPAGQGVITSTATSLAGDTSEFSACPTGVAAPTSTALSSSVNPSTVGQSVTFNATVTGAAPTGTVQFKDGAGNLGSAVALSGGVATLTTSALTQGAHSITAVYSGDPANATSTSPAVNQVVNAPVAGSTTTALASSHNPSVVGQGVTFTATVSGSTPTGSVQFFDGATSLGTGTVSGGVATLSTASLTLGTHSITAAYGGDSDDAASTSPALSQVVNAAVVPPPSLVNPIPTLSDVALLLLAVFIAAVGSAAVRRP